MATWDQATAGALVKVRPGHTGIDAVQIHLIAATGTPGVAYRAV